MTGKDDDPFYQPWNDADNGAEPKRRYPPADEGLKKPEDPPLGIKLSDYAASPAEEGAQTPNPAPAGAESARDALKEAGVQAGKAAKAMAVAAKTGAGKAGAAIGRMELGAKFRAGAKYAGERMGVAGQATAAGLERTASSIGRGASAAGKSLAEAGKSAAEASKSAYDTASEKLGPKLADAAIATQSATRKLAQDAKSSVLRGADAIKAKAAPDAMPRPVSALDDLIQKEGLEPIVVGTAPPISEQSVLQGTPDAITDPAPVDAGMPLFAAHSSQKTLPEKSHADPKIAKDIPSASPPVAVPSAMPVDAAVSRRAEVVSPKPASADQENASITSATPPTPPRASIPALAIPAIKRPEWLSAQMAWGIAIALGLALIFWLGTLWQASRTDAAIRNYLLANPEIIPEAMEAYQVKVQAKSITRLREPLTAAFSGAWMGNPDGDVTLVVFSDYACTFCRQSTPVINRLLKEDKGLKIVYRELPILSAKSEGAARQALAIAKQGKYAAFHNSVMDAPAMTDASLAAAAKASGADMAKVADVAKSEAVTQELNRNVQLARELGFTGTPSWVIGEQAMTGAVGYAALKNAIAKARGS